MSRLSLGAVRTCSVLAWIGFAASALGVLLMLGWVIDSQARPDLYPGSTATVAVICLGVSLAVLAAVVGVLVLVRKHLRYAEAHGPSEPTHPEQSRAATAHVDVSGSYVAENGTHVLQLAKLPFRSASWKWRVELDEGEMRLFVSRFAHSFVVPVSEILGVCNPSLSTKQFGFVPSRKPRVPILYQRSESDAGNFAVVFRTPHTCPPKSTTGKLATMNSSRGAPVDGFRLAVADSTLACQAFASVGITTNRTLQELLFEALGGRSTDEMADSEKRQFWRRQRTRRVLISGISIVLFLAVIAARVLIEN